ncbi:MAG: hypothetical protein CMP57_05085 [Flavobacteriales bacterium]|nr:hypothetical protein [Flavobacteriales bacterium]|tara:strand:- start:2544 stop:3062 length:519 start_codon:yes stop_codon:yes gene_type:complete
MRLTLIIFFVLLFFNSCYQNDYLSKVFIENSDKVLFFIVPECPLCQSYTREIKQLYFKYKDRLDFYFVIPGTSYSSQEMDSFLNKYDLPIDVIYDKGYLLVNKLSATITPEVYLIDENNSIQYQGLIDNWLGELGRKRQNVSEYYLNDAIESFLGGKEVKIKKTNAIGCFIE